MPDEFSISRRQAIQLGMALGLGMSGIPSVLSALAQRGRLLTRHVPSTGELMPVIGMGTARGFGLEKDRPMVGAMVRQLVAQGGKMIETSPSYGASEVLLGEAIAAAGQREQVFLATTITVSSPEAVRRQVAASLERLRTERVDLIQVADVHNAAAMVPFIREWKEANRARYIGVVASDASEYEQLEQVMRRERLDFVQVSMSVSDRRAAVRILPLAVDRGVAVIVNQPFSQGRVFEQVLGKAIPRWARDMDATSWAQIFLKYVIAQQGVTCVVPGTDRPEYLADNLAAARGRVPNAAMLQRIEAAVATRV